MVGSHKVVRKMDDNSGELACTKLLVWMLSTSAKLCQMILSLDGQSSVTIHSSGSGKIVSEVKSSG